MLLKLLALGGLGYAGYRYLEKNSSQPAFADNQGNADVRNAGPASMRDGTDGKWTAVDEELDESFPASDPPANY